MPSDRPRPSIAAIAALLLAVAVSLPLVLGFLKDFHPAFDSFAHFRAHLAVLLALVSLPLLFSALRLHGIAALALGAAALASAFGITPAALLREADARTSEPAGARYRLLQLNLRFDNATPERALSVIARAKPDVITLNEVSAMWRGKLDLIEAAYPHRIICPGGHSVGGVAVLSRRPFATEGQCLDEGRLALATVDFGGRVAEVAALHLHWPWPYAQSAQIEDLKGPLAALGETALLAGDFNAAPWSAAARRLAPAGGLTIVEGVRPSWLPRRFPDAVRRVAGLPIDHVLVKGGVEVRSIRALGGAGSDHLPILLEFSLATQPSREPAVLQARLASLP